MAKKGKIFDELDKVGKDLGKSIDKVAKDTGKSIDKTAKKLSK